MLHTQATGSKPAGPAAEGRKPGPAAARMILGERLHRLREAQYISLREAAEAIRMPEHRMSRMELGRSGFRLRDVADLLTIYEVVEENERATLLALAEQANRHGWWHAYSDVIPDWLHTYLGVEQAAGVIRSYEVQFVPGLLQTPEYARAVIALDHDCTSALRLQRRVDLRMRRQQMLTAPDAPHLWAVIDEAALCRPFGGTETMRGQLRHLVEVADLPHVTLQILPFRAGGHAAAGGPLVLLRLPERGVPDVVYLEQLLSAHYPHEPEDVDHYRHVMDRLVTRAESPRATKGILRRLLERGRAADSL